jgi:large subunit ribosomal protein L21
VELGNVLLVSDGATISVGTPVVEGARMAAKVLTHGKGDKVLVFKKKRRKGYQKLNGHRQYLTELLDRGHLGQGREVRRQQEHRPAPVVWRNPR